MAIRNLHWLNRNEFVDFPIDDVATALDDAGKRLPSGIITDINLRWPQLYGRHAFISAVSIGAKLVTVTIQAAASLDADDFQPVAVVTTTRPIVRGKQYVLKGQVPGAGGWITFGSGTEEEYRGRFSTPRQSFLTPRAARAYSPLPVTGMRHAYSGDLLSGIVRLKAELPLRLDVEQREIDGVLRDVVVLGLTDDLGDEGAVVPTQTQQLLQTGAASVFETFLGPCGKRPESKTCGNPEPIEFINSVAPDCDGVLTLELTGCAVVAQLDDPCGLIVDCGLGLGDACLPKNLPDSAGRLPSEYDPLSIAPPVMPPESESGTPVSESVFEVGELPYVDCFEDFIADDFDVKNGLFSFVHDHSPEEPCSEISESVSTSVSGSVSNPIYDIFGVAYASASAGLRNVSVWEGFDDSTLRRRVTTDLKLNTGPVGALHNGGIVLNYRPHLSLPGQFVYYIAEIDYDNQMIRIARFNGTTFQNAVEVEVPGLRLEVWYRVIVDVVPGVNPQHVKITMRVRGIDDPFVDVTLGPLTAGNYVPSSGRNGFGANRAVTSFSFFQVEEHE